MRTRYVVDTNVLVAASAADPSNPKKIDATPPEPEWRKRVWDWLVAFDQAPSRLIFDEASKIYDEYNNKLGFNDYGIQVVMHKWSTSAVDNVVVDCDQNGNGILPGPLTVVVHDLADRKMVAAALASHASYGEGCVAFAGDTDWHEWEKALAAHHVELEPVIEDWSRAKFEAKKRR